MSDETLIVDHTAELSTDSASSLTEPDTDHPEEVLEEGEVGAEEGLRSASVPTTEEMEDYIRHQSRFLMDVCDDPQTFDYLHFCTVSEAYTVLKSIHANYQKLMTTALCQFVLSYYPELSTPEEVHAKIHDMGSAVDMHWTPADFTIPAPQGTVPQAILKIFHPDARQWLPLLSFGVTMAAVSPETHGVEREGYLPAVVGSSLATAPQSH